jgi:hypothetical protein
MTVDLTTLKVGDTVILRDGSRLPINHIRFNPHDAQPYILSLKESQVSFSKDGRHKSDNYNDLFDIVKIIPKETKETKQEHVSTIAGITGKGDLSKKPHPRALNPDLLKETANCFRFGQLKHGVNNFRKMEPEAAGEIFDALLRHLLDYMSGETHAKDSGLHHLAHADANLHMLYRIIKRSNDKEVLEVISGGDIK